MLIGILYIASISKKWSQKRSLFRLCKGSTWLKSKAFLHWSSILPSSIQQIQRRISILTNCLLRNQWRSNRLSELVGVFRSYSNTELLKVIILTFKRSGSFWFVALLRCYVPMRVFYVFYLCECEGRMVSERIFKNVICDISVWCFTILIESLVVEIGKLKETFSRPKCPVRAIFLLRKSVIHLLWKY